MDDVSSKRPASDRGLRMIDVLLLARRTYLNGLKSLFAQNFEKQYTKDIFMQDGIQPMHGEIEHQKIWKYLKNTEN